jgi:hypothetical protein
MGQLMAGGAVIGRGIGEGFLKRKLYVVGTAAVISAVAAVTDVGPGISQDMLARFDDLKRFARLDGKGWYAVDLLGVEDEYFTIDAVRICRASQFISYCSTE